MQIINKLESDVRGYVRNFPTVFSRAQGSHLIDAEGNSYIDFFAGAGTLNYGHNNPRVKEALLRYISEDGLMHGLDLATEAKVSFLERFEQNILKPRGLDYKFQFTGPTGANAVEAAIKLARKVKKRSNIVAFTNGYHGHSLGALALTGNRHYHDESYGSNSNVTHLPFDGYMGEGVNTIDYFRKLLEDNSSGLTLPAAVILETIQAEGGINVASVQWLQGLAELCHEHDILLIVDDIQVGNGRSGRFFSFEEAGIVPDMVCLSKSLGGGQPFSLVLFKRELDAWLPGQHTGTFRGNQLAFVAATALLDLWEDQCFESQVQTIGQHVQQSLQALVDANSGLSLRGRGMIWGIDFGDGEIAAAISAECFRRQLIIESAGSEGEVLKFLMPLTISQAEFDQGFGIFKQAYKTVCEDADIWDHSQKSA
ncbi:MAG: diaminobutyrate--2-oxoglutarate transaminase [Granulosicoccaceae bacterium]